MRPSLRKVITYSRIYLGNGKYEKKETGEAYFHMWGNNYSNGGGNMRRKAVGYLMLLSLF